MPPRTRGAVRPAGQIRQNQVVTTFGPGAMVDLTDHSVIIAGLDQDYTGKPFEPMPQLLSIAEFITKTHAICVKCGATANYSQRTVESDARVEVGASDKYEARCRKCFVPHADAPTPE